MADYSRTRATAETILSFTSSRLALVNSSLTVKKMNTVDLKDVFHYIDSITNPPMVVVVLSQGGSGKFGNITYNMDLIALAQKMSDIPTSITNLNSVVDDTLKALDYQIDTGVIYQYMKENSVDPDKWSMVVGSVVSFQATDTGVTS